MRRRYSGPVACLAVVLLVVGLLGGCGSSNNSKSSSSSPGGSSKTTNPGAPRHGGTMTVLENSGYMGAWPLGLDPATNTSDAADDPYMEAIYGNLFDFGNKGQVRFDLATGYKFQNGGKDFVIELRHGVTFSDGTPFNAAAVKWNIDRDLDPKNACICATSFPVASIDTPDDYTVVLHLKQVFAPIVLAFQSQAPNWIASPTAYQKMGENAFKLMPVGAGPFVVTKDVVNTELDMKANPTYWKKGQPYLANLVFKSIGSDQSAYSAILAGQADYEQQVAYNVAKTAKTNPKIQVVSVPPVGAFGVQLNTRSAPFNDIRAREATYYAMDPEAMSKALTDGTAVVSQTGDGPGSIFPFLTVPGYRTYNLAKAKALVKELGGLSFSLTTGPQTDTLQQAEALQSQWQAAGMKVTLNTVNLAQLVKAFETKSWDAALGGAGGGLDPAIGLGGMTWRTLSTAPFTGIDDPTLDQLINQASGTLDHATRAKLYKQIFKIISDKAYGPFYYGTYFYNMASTRAHGPGVSTNQLFPFWDSVWVS